MRYAYDPYETRHCAACGKLGHIGGMLVQPGMVWVHKRCARGGNAYAVEESRILAAIRHWRKKLKHKRWEPRSEKRLVKEVT